MTISHFHPVALSLSMLALSAAHAALAQTPAGRAAITEKLDTPQAHVFVATLQPHTPVPSPNGHATNRLLIYMDDGVMTRQEGSGKPETITFKRGDVRWRPASGAYVAQTP